MSSHHPQEVLLAQFSLYVYTGGLEPHPFNLIDVLLLSAYITGLLMFYYIVYLIRRFTLYILLLVDR